MIRVDYWLFGPGIHSERELISRVDLLINLKQIGVLMIAIGGSPSLKSPCIFSPAFADMWAAHKIIVYP